MTVQVHNTEKTLAELVDIAASGEEVVIMRDGKTIVRMKADDPTQPDETSPRGRRQVGTLAHMGFRVPDDINTPFKDEIDAMFYGDSHSKDSSPVNENGSRRFGFLKQYGYKIPDDFNEMGCEEIERDFYGEE